MAKLYDSIAVRPITGGNFRVNQLYPDAATYTATPSTQLTPSSTIDTLDLQLLDQPTLAMSLRGHLAQVSSLPDVETTRKITKRLMPGLSLSMATPAYINGRPMSPKYWGQNDNGTTFTLDQSPGHLQGGFDPNPIWQPNVGWLVAPPAGIGGVGTYRWHVQNFPQPADYGGEIPIGARSQSDGSSVMPATAAQWLTDPATPGGPAWQSLYPYKPTLVQYSHINQDGSTVTYDRALLFNRHFANHMTATFPSNQNAPFSWVVVGIILNNAGSTINYILDSGYPPAQWVSGLTEDNVSNNRDFPGVYEGLRNRTRMYVDKSKIYISSGRSGGAISATRYNSIKPQMFYGVWNTNNSYVGARTTSTSKKTKGRTYDMTGFPWRRMLLGRANGAMGVSYGADMLVFEIRYWNRALTTAELNGQFNQLSTTWQFARFK